MTQPSPKISILMPVFNAERYLEESVRSILDQSFREFELLVIDDSSTDGTVKLLRSFHDDRIVIVSTGKRLGLPESLNLGIKMARGEYIARMDADDVADVRRLEIQHRFLTDHPETGIVSSKILLIDEEGRTSGRWSREFSPEEIYYHLHFNNILGHSTVMGRRTVFLEYGGYSNRFDKIEDFHLWQRISEMYPILLIPRYLLRIRVHKESVSQRNLGTQQKLIEDLVKARLESLLEEDLDPQAIFLIRMDSSGFLRIPTPYPDNQLVFTALDLLSRANEKIASRLPVYASKTKLETSGDEYFTMVSAFSLARSPLRDCIYVLLSVAKERERSFLRPFVTLLLMKAYYRLRGNATA